MRHICRRKEHEACCLPTFKELQIILIASLNAPYIRKECSKVKSPLSQEPQETLLGMTSLGGMTHTLRDLCCPPVICPDTITHYRQPAVAQCQILSASVESLSVVDTLDRKGGAKPPSLTNILHQFLAVTLISTQMCSCSYANVPQCSCATACPWLAV